MLKPTGGLGRPWQSPGGEMFWLFDIQKTKAVSGNTQKIL